MLSERALLIGELLEEASKIALQFYHAPSTELKEDQTVVTLADKAIEKYIVSRLEDVENGVYVIGEETSETKSPEYIEQALKNKAWVIDPIDGTSMYASRIALWGISIGYAENGVLIDGGVLAPCTAEMLLSSNGKAYYTPVGTTSDVANWRERIEEITPPQLDFDGKVVIGAGQRQVHAGRFTCKNTINAFCSTIYCCILLATGRHGAMISQAKLWDYAGSIPALSNLGFYCTSMSGKVDILNGEISAENYAVSNDAKTPCLAKESIYISSKKEYAEKALGMWEQIQ